MRGELHTLTSLPPVKKLGTHRLEGWVGSKPCWTFWRREKSLAPDKLWTPDCPAHSLVTVLNTLS